MEKNSLTNSQEFLNIPFSKSDATLCSAGLKNMPKNRYKNVLPVDNTRVILSSSSGDYINANFIDLDHLEDLNGQREIMIACQGPKKDTESDFWHMIYQYKINAVLMLSDIVEDGKEKCSQYWPEVPGMFKTYEKINLICDAAFRESNFVVTVIYVSKGSEERHKIFHLKYIGWKDFSIPKANEFEDLIRVLHKYKIGNYFVCHCSAGLGRTGIVASILRIKNTGETARDAVEKIRRQRHGMVQTKEQFKFICDFVEKMTFQNINL